MPELSRTKRKLKDSSSFPTGANDVMKRLKSNVDFDRDNLYPTRLFSTHQPPTSRTERSLRAPTQLCRRCAKLDINTWLSRQHKTRRGLPVATLSPVSKWSIDSCTFCNLLYSTLSPGWSDLPIKHRLHSFSTNKISSTWWTSIKTNSLEIEDSSRFIVSQPEGLNGPVRIIEEKITNFETVMDWIRLCRNHHTTVCSIGIISSVPSLRLIDCKTGKIVAAANHPYVALSYVWGLSSETFKDPDELPEKLPQTIRDAMTVTENLDFRYLWVDRYCINQQRKEDVAEQVGKMDLIYQNAELTIVAAAGEDPSYGLPGVCERKRMSRHLTTCAKAGKHFLISVSDSPTQSALQSKWMTRAWTYQEGLLSRRRLVFTEEQMYFECYGMYCCESINLSIEEMHRQDMQGFKSVYCTDNHVGMFPKGVGSTSIEIFRRIEEYLRRSLGNPEDILKGMLGIFHAFERGRLSIKHCSGIPILLSMPGRSKTIERWTPAMGFIIGMFWELNERAERRPGFPSWSWTGWHGPVTWKDPYWPTITVDPNVQLSVELIDGRVLKWESFQESLPKLNLSSELFNFIHLTAWTTQIRIERRERERHRNKDIYTAKVDLEDGGYVLWQFPSDSTVELSRGQICKGIILGYCVIPMWSPTRPAVMVVRETNDTIERIGYGWVDVFNHERFTKDNVRQGGVSVDERNRPIEDRIDDEPLNFASVWEEIRLG